MVKLKYPLILILLFAAAGGALVYRHALEPQMANRHSSKAIYYCPMHPTYTSDKPGDCPICNMKLVKREEQTPQDSGLKMEPKVMTLAEFKKLKPGEICMLHKCKMGTCLMAVTEDMARLGKCPHCEEDLGVIIRDFLPLGYSPLKLSPEKQKLIGIQTAFVQKKAARKNLRLAGKVTLDRELYEAEEVYLQAFQFFRRMGLGQREMNKARLQLKRSGLNDELIEEIEKAGRPDKYLVSRWASPKAWVYLQVYEHERALLKPGQEITAETPSVPGKQFRGIFRAVGEVPDPLTHAVLARVLVENPDKELKPQMDVSVLLPLDAEKTGLMIPDSAIFSTEGKNIVFLARPEGVFEPREVTPGILGEDGREILSGLSEGDEVVISGNFLIHSESRLKGSLEGMNAGEGHRHGG